MVYFYSKHIRDKARIFLLFFALVFVTNISLAADKFPQLSRFDLGLILADGFCQNNQITNNKKYLGYCADSDRAYGLDINSRTSIASLGGKSELSNLFYLALDSHIAGTKTKLDIGELGETRFGFSFNAGFLYPLLADKGNNRFLVSNRSQPVILNLLFELGFGYSLGINDFNINGAKHKYLFHIFNPSLAFGTNMSFKNMPEVELEIAYKLNAGWRHNLYAKVQYDFLQFGEDASLGAYVLVDALWGSVDLGLGFKY